MLAGRKVLVGVTGSIAAYRAAEVVRGLVREGAETRVVMTAAARRFVSHVTFATLSGHPVATRLFDGGPVHIELARFAEAAVVVPATANILGKVAHGIADDLLSTVLLACTAPVLFCPAMNASMYRHPAVQASIGRLKEMGYHFAEPGTGALACGEEGPGRLAEPEAILEHVGRLLAPKDLAGLTVLVTAGPTREPLDPVRFISNRSSGKMGYAVAAAAAARGARVILVSGPTQLAPPAGVETVWVETAREMLARVREFYPAADVVVKAAAVADYRPAGVSEHKIKKEGETLHLVLEKNPDILATLGREKGRRILVGFAAETEELVPRARRKLEEKNLDLLVANDVTLPGAGFGTDTNVVQLVYRDGRVVPLPLMTKRALAHRILDEVLRLRAAPGP